MMQFNQKEVIFSFIIYLSRVYNFFISGRFYEILPVFVKKTTKEKRNLNLLLFIYTWRRLVEYCRAYARSYYDRS